MWISYSWLGFSCIHTLPEGLYTEKIKSLVEYFTVSLELIAFLTYLPFDKLTSKQIKCLLLIRSQFNVVQRKAWAVPRSSAHERDTRNCKSRLHTCDCQWRLFDGENIRWHWKMSTGDRLFFCYVSESSSMESVSFQVKFSYLIDYSLEDLTLYACYCLSYRVGHNILFHGN